MQMQSMINMLKVVFNNIYRSILRRYYRFKCGVIIDSGAIFSHRTVFEGRSRIHRNTVVSDSFIGVGTYIAPNSKLIKTKIGRFCSIGSNVQSYIGRHPATEYVSTHPAFFSTKKQAGFTFVCEDRFEEHRYLDQGRRYVVEIGCDVWIGNNVMIMDGVRIGDGAVIGAGAVVTRDIEPYSIVGGIPAKIIKYRFDKQTIGRLLEFKWWEKGYDWAAQNAELFSDVKKFMDVAYKG